MRATNTIGFAGLSHLGIIYSIATAARGFSVLAFDERGDLARELSAGRFPVSEPGLDDAFRDHGERLRYTSDASSLADCGLIFITLDVPTDAANNSNLAPLEELIDRVASIARPDTTIAIMSQLPPGYCRRLAGRLSPTLKLYYHVETLVFGNAMERAIHPERYMVGCADPAHPFPDLYQEFLQAFHCPVLPMRYESAELCKIAINCFLVSSVSTTNMLAEICERIQADWLELAPALRLDKRIGPHAYLSPGLGIAGGNLERDLVTMKRMGEEYGTDTRLVTAWQQNSLYRRDWVLRLLAQRGLLREGSAADLAIWGLAYKPDTHSTKNSPSLALIRALSGYRLRAYDPAVTITAEEFPDTRCCGTPLEAARSADAVVIMTPWKEFGSVPLVELKAGMRGNQIIDPFAALNESSCRQLGFDYTRLGS